MLFLMCVCVCVGECVCLLAFTSFVQSPLCLLESDLIRLLKFSEWTNESEREPGNALEEQVVAVDGVVAHEEIEILRGRLPWGAVLKHGNPLLKAREAPGGGGAAVALVAAPESTWSHTLAH